MNACGKRPFVEPVLREEASLVDVTLLSVVPTVTLESILGLPTA